MRTLRGGRKRNKAAVSLESDGFVEFQSLFVERPDIQLDAVKAHPRGLLTAKGDERGRSALAAEGRVHAEFLNVIEAPCEDIGRLRAVDKLGDGDAAADALCQRAAHNGGDGIKFLIDMLLQFCTEAGTENVRTAVGVQLVYHFPQLIDTRKLRAVGISDGNFHFTLSFQ